MCFGDCTEFLGLERGHTWILSIHALKSQDRSILISSSFLRLSCPPPHRFFWKFFQEGLKQIWHHCCWVTHSKTTYRPFPWPGTILARDAGWYPTCCRTKRALSLGNAKILTPGIVHPSTNLYAAFRALTKSAFSCINLVGSSKALSRPFPYGHFPSMPKKHAQTLFSWGLQLLFLSGTFCR